jgi:hypothetical protein
MTARKRLTLLPDVKLPGLRRKLRRNAGKKKDLDAMLKDAHLLEAALATDRIVASLDDLVRALFAGASKKDVREISRIMWINPHPNCSDVSNWLAEGGKDDNSRFLSNM